MDQRLVIIVTGANTGVGFGVCHRLLIQLSSPSPSDIRPHGINNYALAPRSETVPPHVGLTLVMACRSSQRADAARTRLNSLLAEHISTLRPGSPEYVYATAFRASVKIEVETLDLASMKSIVDFGATITQKYEYISHLILNAGTVQYSHINFPLQLRDMLFHPIFAATHPRANVQKSGMMSEDNLGYIWQCNFFGHYCVYRSLQPLLTAYACVSGDSARVVWMSSLVAAPLFDPVDDWQLTKTIRPYEGSKFQVDLVASELERLSAEAQESSATSMSLPEFISPNGAIHHLISSPGIVPTNMMDVPGKTSSIMKIGTAIFFWIARLVGGYHIHLSTYASAIATVFLALSPLKVIYAANSMPTTLPGEEKYPQWHVYHNVRTERVQALRMGSKSNRLGKEYIGVVAVPLWEEHREFGERLLEKCEQLYQTFGLAMAAAL